MDNLEQRVVETGVSPVEQEGLYQKIRRKSTDYLVDISAGWTFFTPIYAAMEKYVAGMSNEEVVDARTAGLVAHAIAMRPTGVLRNVLSRRWSVTKESPWYKKVAVNVCAGTPIQAVMYTGMLKYAGASLQEIAVALPVGLGMAIPLFVPFGKWMDTWRKFWNKKPAIA